MINMDLSVNMPSEVGVAVKVLCASDNEDRAATYRYNIAVKNG